MIYCVRFAKWHHTQNVTPIVSPFSFYVVGAYEFFPILFYPYALIGSGRDIHSHGIFFWGITSDVNKNPCQMAENFPLNDKSFHLLVSRRSVVGNFQAALLPNSYFQRSK
ncbi:MAG: hypothetical protein B6244_04150 [Candidatus Cloacimonetes bacterium 4572_55]|nr:MAG: hypothetical protein B6244_04150 [Candidatus Cloacimonetes bacterium 4572_55]